MKNKLEKDLNILTKFDIEYIVDGKTKHIDILGMTLDEAKLRFRKFYPENEIKSIKSKNDEK